MKKTFNRLDKRNTGYGKWMYYINRPRTTHGPSSVWITVHDANQLFYSWREWCWAHWGASKELQNWLADELPSHMSRPNLTSHNDRWCWQHDQYNTRIYLRTDRELSEFLMKWY